VATRKQADLARELHSDQLAKDGAHAIEVAKGAEYGKTGFVVVAHVAPGEKHALPSRLTAKVSGQLFSVDVVAKVSDQFEPE